MNFFIEMLDGVGGFADFDKRLRLGVFDTRIGEMPGTFHALGFGNHRLGLRFQLFFCVFSRFSAASVEQRRHTSSRVPVRIYPPSEKKFQPAKAFLLPAFSARYYETVAVADK